MAKYSIGIDFGTLSARALVADVANGRVIGSSETFEYPHGVMTELCEQKLPDSYALQHPDDYILALTTLIPTLMQKNSLSPDDVVGIGIDFTACTVLPLDKNGVPLCDHKEFERDPHAYAKLWKHGGANKYAERIEDIAKGYGDMLKITGGTLSGEFMIPKLYETFIESPKVYEATEKFINAGDFVASLLCGRYVHSTSFATIKEHCDNRNGAVYPPRKFYRELAEGFEDVLDKLGTELDSVGDSCGTLTDEWAERLGLSTKTHVAVPIIDAHGAFGVAGIDDGIAVAVLGTSAVMAVLSSKKRFVRGIHAAGYGATAKGLMTYEAGIRAMGDLYAWFVQNCVPAEYEREAAARGMNIHAYLRSLAEKKKVGQSGLIALDWWNGNRSVVPNDKLSGMILGLRLGSRPEDIYRALIESTVFELRRVYENYTESGIEIKSFVATGGIAAKDPMLMQILSDVLGREVDCLTESNATSLGVAVFGATAAGVYDSLESASAKMKLPIAKTYRPIPENVDAYDKLYRRYVELYDYFAAGGSDVMNFLYDFKNNINSKEKTK